jgi:ADP-dependent NAD(P)H-hydrate dehydratase
MLAGLAALRVGAGRLTLAVAESVAVPVAVAVPESGVLALPETSSGSILGVGADQLAGRLESCDALLVGSGLDDPEETAELLNRLVDLVGEQTAVVLDAYALGVLTGVPRVTQRWARRLILTPNTQELERLLELNPGDLSGSASKRSAVIDAASKYEAVVTSGNLIANHAGEVWQTRPGTIGLGTSGSGDVLGGAVLGLLGRGADPAQAACWATHLHLTAGHRLTGQVGTVGFLAREILEQLPGLLEELN